MARLSRWSVLALRCLAAAATSPIATVRNGTYAGIHLPALGQDVFLGMPYAQSTAGPNRFRVPQALDSSWDGARPATRYGPACPDHRPDQDARFGMGEDCLSINVVRPAGLGEAQRVPVVVWIHGGSYQVGTAGLPYYNLSRLVERSVAIGKPVVAASINYRKGGWGMLYSVEVQGSGNANLALRDMRKALAWVSENIGAFGGDSDAVTIWGQSAGSFAVGQLVNSYGGRTDGLFHRAIQDSGSAATAWYNGTEWYQPIYDALVERANCSSWPDTLACLRTVPYEAIYPLMDSSKLPGPGFYPTVDGDVIPNFPTAQLHAGDFAHVPRLYGSNSDEGTDNAPLGAIDTDQDLYRYLLEHMGSDYPPAVVDELMRLYPDDPSQGIPLDTGPERFAAQGLQYKRAAAVVGDIFYHGPRLDDARHFARHAPTWVYRFNTRAFANASTANFTDAVGGLAPAYKGVAHFAEMAFVLADPEGVGPWSEYRALSDQLSAQWISFIHAGDPNDEGLGLPRWPRYNEGKRGLNLVLQANGRGQNGSYVEEDTWRLEGRELIAKWARRRHV